MNDSKPEAMARLKSVSALGTEAGAAVLPLVNRADLQVVEEPLLPLFSLRLSRKQAQADAERFAEHCGLSLPGTPGTVRGDARCAVAFIEPRGWWLLGTGMGAAVDGVALPRGAYLTELTARFCVLTIRGAAARALLASSVSLDLSEAAFPEGRCARTKFAEFAAVYLQRIGEDYRIAIDVSLGLCIAAWLRDAAAQTGSQGRGLLAAGP